MAIGSEDGSASRRPDQHRAGAAGGGQLRAAGVPHAQRHGHNAVIFHTTLDMMTAVRELIADDWSITLEDRALAALLA